jgi:hypothetical protein
MQPPEIILVKNGLNTLKTNYSACTTNGKATGFNCIFAL